MAVFHSIPYSYTKKWPDTPWSGLTSRAWWSREDFPWVDQLEGAFPEIKARAGLTGDHLDPPGHGKPQRAWWYLSV
jgi:hypothetical protein